MDYDEKKGAEDWSVDRYIRECFSVEDTDIRTYSPLTLAYIGDAVFELIIRTVVVGKGNTKPNRLHGCTSQIVRAQTQAKLMDELEPLLTEEEKAVYRRGHNARSHSTAKNASPGDYHKATGFEALIGYLYLTDRLARAVALTRQATERLHLLEQI